MNVWWIHVGRYLFWDMFASGGAFNLGTEVVCETFASPDMIASWGAFMWLGQCSPLLKMPCIEEYNQ